MRAHYSLEAPGAQQLPPSPTTARTTRTMNSAYHLNHTGAAPAAAAESPLLPPGSTSSHAQLPDSPMTHTAAGSDAQFDAVPTEPIAPSEMAAPSFSDVPLPAASSPSDTAVHATSRAMSMVRRDDGLYFEFYGLPLEPLDFSAAEQTGCSGQGTSQSVLHSPPAPHEREPMPRPLPIATTKPAERKPSPLRGPGPAEVAKSLTDASAHFERYQDCLIKNFVGEHRLRLADASHLADANIRDWEDLKCISAHIKGLVEEAERELREKEQEATSIGDAQTESNLGQTIRSSIIEASLLPIGHHSPRADERTEESPDPKHHEEECRRYRSLAGARAARTIRQEREALHQMAARAGGNARGYTCHGEVLACPRQTSQAPAAAVQAKQPRAPLARAHPSRRERYLIRQQAVAQTKEPLGQGPSRHRSSCECERTATPPPIPPQHPARTSVMIDLRPPTKLECTPARLSASASSPAFHQSENLSTWNPSLPCVSASLPGWSAARVMTGVCGHAASRYAAFSGVRLADRPQCWSDPPSGLGASRHHRAKETPIRRCMARGYTPPSSAGRRSRVPIRSFDVSGMSPPSSPRARSHLIAASELIASFGEPVAGRVRRASIEDASFQQAHAYSPSFNREPSSPECISTPDRRRLSVRLSYDRTSTKEGTGTMGSTMPIMRSSCKNLLAHSPAKSRRKAAHRGKDHMWFESVLSHEVIEYNAIRIQCAWRVKVARLQWRDEKGLNSFRKHAALLRARKSSQTGVAKADGIDFQSLGELPSVSRKPTVPAHSGSCELMVPATGLYTWSRAFVCVSHGSARLEPEGVLGMENDTQKALESASKSFPLSLVGHVVELARTEDTNRPFVLDLINAEKPPVAGRHPSPTAKLSFMSFTEAERWRVKFLEEVATIEKSLAHQMNIALAWVTQVALPAQLAHDEDRRAFEAALDDSDEQLKIILPPLPLPPEHPVDEIASSSLPRDISIRKEIEKSVQTSIAPSRMLLSAFFCIKGSILTEMPARGTNQTDQRVFRLLPETSEIQIDGFEPQPLLGVVPSLSPWALQEIRVSTKRATQRGFRLILESSELNVIASSPAEKDHWLLAIRTLPFGEIYLGRLHFIRKSTKLKKGSPHAFVTPMFSMRSSTNLDMPAFSQRCSQLDVRLARCSSTPCASPT